MNESHDSLYSVYPLLLLIDAPIEWCRPCFLTMDAPYPSLSALSFFCATFSSHRAYPQISSFHIHKIRSIFFHDRDAIVSDRVVYRMEEMSQLVKVEPLEEQPTGSNQGNTLSSSYYIRHHYYFLRWLLNTSIYGQLNSHWLLFPICESLTHSVYWVQLCSQLCGARSVDL